MSNKTRCRACHIEYTPGLEPDPCLGWLPGITAACCGHGDGYAVMVFDDLHVLKFGGAVTHVDRVPCRNYGTPVAELSSSPISTRHGLPKPVRNG